MLLGEVLCITQYYSYATERIFITVLVRFYDDRFTSLRFLNYIGRQRADAEMVNIFVTGGKKEETRKTVKQKGKGKAKEEKRNKKLKPFEQDYRTPLVALGNAVFPSSMKGTIPGLARRLVKKLKIAEREGLLVTVPVTEYMTSKTCSNCSRNDTENVEIDGVTLFSVLLCLNQTSTGEVLTSFEDKKKPFPSIKN
ncbi:hypothetical protein EDC94DRAFT_586030 [Helicostylum pulchrum]|nr:hypothetical protein EDC94DRAFT_586030 [Helicostylum pulchrum]